jgi:hypothetical protein
MSIVRRALLVAVAGLVAGCSAGSPPAGTIPTAEEARGLLDQLVSRARARDFEGLCALGDGNCEQSLEEAGRDAIPPRPPTIVGTSIIPTSTTAEGQRSFGGVVLVLCGIDGHGEHYDSEMLVFHGGNGLRAINPIYWGRTRIAATPNSEEPFEPISC